uniref:Uncharacterized protein n=1 Tax=Arundo donax TaxID=35708 RepID=A0A0A9G497_ARUDO
MGTFDGPRNLLFVGLVPSLSHYHQCCLGAFHLCTFRDLFGVVFLPNCFTGHSPLL